MELNLWSTLCVILQFELVHKAKHRGKQEPLRSVTLCCASRLLPQSKFCFKKKNGIIDLCTISGNLWFMSDNSA